MRSIISAPTRSGSAATEGNPTVAFTFTAPLNRQIYQRNPSTLVGTIPISGSTTGTSAKARVIKIEGEVGTTSAFQNLTVSGGAVSGSILAAPGWYNLEIKIYSGSTLLSRNILPQVGVGDIFITAGQSNFANYYATLTTANPNDKVNARGITGGTPWQRAADPQPGPDNTNSSVFPKLGDLITARTTYPVGFISVAQGNTAVVDWIPGTANYTKIHTAITTYLSGANAFRAFLWHQGENDGAFSTTQGNYTSRLQLIIDEIRADAGWQVPCLIAKATHPNEVAGAGVILAQVAVGTTYLGCFAGANTDSLDDTYRSDGVHFNATTGRNAHAQLWYDALVAAGLI